jgi:hypothetical protein
LCDCKTTTTTKSLDEEPKTPLLSFSFSLAPSLARSTPTLLFSKDASSLSLSQFYRQHTEKQILAAFPNNQPTHRRPDCFRDPRPFQNPRFKSRDRQRQNSLSTKKEERENTNKKTRPLFPPRVACRLLPRNGALHVHREGCVSESTGGRGGGRCLEGESKRESKERQTNPLSLSLLSLSQGSRSFFFWTRDKTIVHWARGSRLSAARESGRAEDRRGTRLCPSGLARWRAA